MKFKGIKGYLLAATAAAAYGTNPAFAIPLYADGMNPNTVLLFRYLMGVPILAMIMKWRGITFSLDRRVIAPVAILGCLMAFSSLTLFESYNYMNSGVASTLLFVYPVMVAVIMIFFFHEKFRISVLICLFVMASGLAFLMKTDGVESLSYVGTLLVVISALTYALYIVLVNVSGPISRVPTTKLLFYVLVCGSIVFTAMIPLGNPFTPPAMAVNWLNLLALAVIPTIISLVCTTLAIHLIGSTPTAILGALEPVTAIVLSVVVLHQGLTQNEIIGGLLIIAATTIVVSGRSVDSLILHIRKMFPRNRL